MRLDRFCHSGCLFLVIAQLPAQAQAEDHEPFSGTHAGAGAGIVEHHFYVEAQTGNGTRSGKYHRSHGAGGTLFAGHDFAVSRGMRIGGEVAAVLGGRTNRASLPSGDLAYVPRFGYRLTARIGFTPRKNLMLYASGGYGGHRYRIDNQAGIAGASAWNSSFIVGGGGEFRLNDTIGIRLDYKHLDNATHEFMLGIPVRF